MGVVIFSSGCTNNVYKTYNSNGISFNYPSGWSELSPDKLNVKVQGNTQVLASVVDPASIQNNNYQILAFFQQVTTTTSLADSIAANKADIQAAGGQVISEKDSTINGLAAKDMVYTITTPSGVAKKERLVALQDGSNLYYIICSAPTSDFDAQQSNFDLIVNSFKVE
jgi:predicted neuraminidase